MIVYEHYKGGLYTVLMSAEDSTTRETVMVYVSHTTGKILVRPAKEFFDVVKWPDGKKHYRFVPTFIATPVTRRKPTRRGKGKR